MTSLNANEFRIPSVLV